MTNQVLFSLKNNETVFINVVCCSRGWRLRVKFADFQLMNALTLAISIVLVGRLLYTDRSPSVVPCFSCHFSFRCRGYPGL